MKTYIKSNKKRILVYAHYYIPDVASTGQICADIAEGLSGYFDVTVICVVPSYMGNIDKKYNDRKLDFFKEEINGVHVLRVKVPSFNKKSKLSRINNILAYYLKAKKATRSLGHFDYIFSVSQPPILGGMLGVYGSRKKKAKFIYNIQDINPEQTIAVGYSHNGAILKAMMMLDKRSCLKADLIITVGRDLVETINNRFKNSKRKPKKVIMINNWIDEKRIFPLSPDNQGVIAFKKEFKIENKFIFMYSGNIGLYYDLEGLLKTIKQIKPGTKSSDGREVVFVFVGSGTILEKLKKYKNENDMENVFFIPYQSKEKLIYSLNAADVHFCISAKGIKGVSCPSKYYGISAVSKPIIAVLDEGSEVYCLLKENSNARISRPGDYLNLYNNICAMYNSPIKELKEMGAQNFKTLKNRFTKQISISKYVNEIMRIE